MSVIIPTYLGASYLERTLSSVLAQTYQNFEVILVNDASPDNTGEVVAGFADSRLRYLVHGQNRGAGHARNTATNAAHGELIAFLDQDDLYLPEALEQHVAHFDATRDLGASYSGRFDLAPSGTGIRDIWLLPDPITLADLVLGFPLAPSDLVLHRQWAVRPDVEEVHRIFHGGEIIRYGRLYLDGCLFAPIKRALGYHRMHANRKVRHIERNCDDYLEAQRVILDDPRCPPAVVALRHQAYAGSCLTWAWYAFAQQETELGQKLLRKALAFAPDLADGSYCEVTRFMAANCMDDDTWDHEALLRSIFAQLPPELAALDAQLDQAIASGYLARGTRSILWERTATGAACFASAVRLNAPIDDAYIGKLTHQLLNYENELGLQAMLGALDRLAPYLEQLGAGRSARRLKARLAANRALRNYRARAYPLVPSDCLQAMVNDPQFITNRGIVSVLVRSLAQLAAGEQEQR